MSSINPDQIPAPYDLRSYTSDYYQKYIESRKEEINQRKKEFKKILDDIPIQSFTLFQGSLNNKDDSQSFSGDQTMVKFKQNMDDFMFALNENKKSLDDDQEKPILESTFFTSLTALLPHLNLESTSYKQLITALCHYINFIYTEYSTVWKFYMNTYKEDDFIIRSAFAKSEESIKDKEEIEKLHKEIDKLKQKIQEKSDLEAEEAPKEVIDFQALRDCVQKRNELEAEIRFLNKSEESSIPYKWIMADAQLIKILEAREMAIEAHKIKGKEERKAYIAAQLQYSVELNKLRRENQELKALLSLYEPELFKLSAS